ncbi:MAG: hypothetical protein JWM57_1306 [Phycisphaerales bacterium]|nr:hypothetical protein [Phycisphaerales bacterium]
MNNLYFACSDCKVYVDAGYRWAYWTLVHPGIVTHFQPVDVDRVLNASEFWLPPQDATLGWLYDDVLPELRRFLAEHQSHHLVFCDRDAFPNHMLLTWLQLGRMPWPTARFFAETLALTSWEAVLDYDKQLGHGTLEFLLYDDAQTAAFRAAFEGWVQKRRSSDPAGAA